MKKVYVIRYLEVVGGGRAEGGVGEGLKGRGEGAEGEDTWPTGCQTLKYESYASVLQYIWFLCVHKILHKLFTESTALTESSTNLLKFSTYVIVEWSIT